MRGEAEQARGREAGSPLTDVLLQILLVANSFIMLFPILMMALWGFKNTNEIFGKPFAIPDFGNLKNFVTILAETNFFGYLLNSMIITGAAAEPRIRGLAVAAADCVCAALVGAPATGLEAAQPPSATRIAATGVSSLRTSNE